MVHIQVAHDQGYLPGYPLHRQLSNQGLLDELVFVVVQT